MTTALALDDVYLDASLIVDALITDASNWRVSNAFLARLVAGKSRVYFSQITYLEISEAVRKLATKQQVPEEPRQRYQLNRWGMEAQVRQRRMEFGLRQFELLRGRFAEVYEMPFRETLWRQSINLMVDYRLRGHDAVHVATALDAGIQILATNDSDFRRVNMLDVIIVREG